MEKSVKKRMAELGVGKGGGVYLQVDENVIRRAVIRALEEKGVILLDLEEALDELPEAKRAYWSAFKGRLDGALKRAKELEEHGVVLYVPREVKVDLPVQACFLISKRGFEQVVHNLIIVGDEAELTINTACAAIAGETLHLGVTEMFVGRRAKLSYVMVHGWVSTSRVNPRTAAIVEEGGSLTMFYANLKPVAVIEASTTIRLRSGADASLSSVLVGKGASRIRVGGRIVLEESGARGELVSRAIASGSSRIELPTALIATAPKVKGHIECRGLQLSRESKIVSIPLLRSLVGDVELTHEASIGRLSEEELLYLQSRGFSEDEALSLLIRGFAEVGVDKLPEALKPQVRVVLDAIARYAHG